MKLLNCIIFCLITFMDTAFAAGKKSRCKNPAGNIGRKIILGGQTYKCQKLGKKSEWIKKENEGIRNYCQPTNSSCWPTSEEIDAFRGLFSDESCLGLPKFVYIDDDSAHEKKCLKYMGLQFPSPNQHQYGSKSIHGAPETPANCVQTITSKANMYCSPNPYITDSTYQDVDTTSNPNTLPKIACMSVFQFLTNRNFFVEWKPAFIVTAESTEDIKHALSFANQHDLGVSIMATGHELADRNAGPGPNSLLIRTTCFRKFEFHDEPITGFKDEKWTDGYAKMGAGMTWGINYWWNLENAEGVYGLAAAHKRAAVGGTCHSVGIVGWTMGGGRGWIAPLRGMGVDQVLAMTVVLANGTVVNADYSKNKDLFRAMRGGGPGFGIVTEMTLKLHKICDTDDCYHQHQYVWTGQYTGSSTINFIKNLTNTFVDFSTKHRDIGWNCVITINFNADPEVNDWTVVLGAKYFGLAINATLSDQVFNQFNSSSEIAFNFTSYSHMNLDKYWCDTNPSNGNLSCEYQESHQFSRIGFNIPFFMFNIDSQEAKSESFVNDFFSLWTPLCLEQGKYSGCAKSITFRGDYPPIAEGKEEYIYSTNNVMGSKNKKASFAIYVNDVEGTVHNNNTLAEQMAITHYEFAPLVHKYTANSYFNEAEYFLKRGQWISRFWDLNTYAKLVEIKKKYDPEIRFACRHCVGNLDGDNLGN